MNDAFKQTPTEIPESVVVFDGELTGLGDSGIIAAMGDHGHPYNSF